MNLINKIYLDNNATTKLDEKVLAAMIPFFTDYYENAGSSHLAGLTVNEHLENALWQISNLIIANPNDLIITSGATEAINLAIRGLSNRLRNHFITVNTEHKAVLDTIKALTEEGNYLHTSLLVDNNGRLDLDLLDNAISENTLLVNIMMTNNETGVLQDIRQISEIVHRKGAYLLCDATQAVGKIPINVEDLGIDLMPFSAHKIYGPKGVGALYISKEIKNHLQPQITGGGQQRNRRSGTLNVPGIIGLGKACEIAKIEMQNDKLHITKLRDELERELLKINGTFVNGSTEHRIYNTTNICFPGVLSEKLIISLQNISVSSGSACSSITANPSHVLKAMGLSDEEALSSIRFSLGRFNTAEQIEFTISRVKELIKRYRV